MCGIIGYVGKGDLPSVLVAGLERLSYRGYDSSGIAVIGQNELAVWKSEGKVQRLIQRHTNGLKIPGGTVGIGHTRWATHGPPSDVNAHPHTSANHRIAVVHNGIIENFAAIKTRLAPQYLFQSETDTETIAHLIQAHTETQPTLLAALQAALAELDGQYALAIIAEQAPNTLFAARKGSPLIIGIGIHEYFIASDLVALLPHTRRVIHLEDGHIAALNTAELKIFDQTGIPVKPKITTLNVSSQNATFAMPTKAGHPHYMRKEIFEQPAVLKRIAETYIDGAHTVTIPSLAPLAKHLNKCERFILQACGTSWHAGLVAKYWIEDFAHIPTEVDISSEFRYRRILARSHDIALALSQSGETADTLAGIREFKKLHPAAAVISFINRSSTTMERESDAIVPSLAAMEIGVASTKNYIAQLGTLFLFALALGQKRKIISSQTAAHYLKEFAALPAKIEQILAQRETITACAARYANHQGCFFIGRGFNYPTALEGALKLKEISYLYAAGYAAGELKHGPIALIDENMPVVVIIPQTSHYAKMMSNLEEVRSRKGRIIAIATEGDANIHALADTVLSIPPTIEPLTPLLSIIPLQLFAYDVAVRLGRDVDQPKNLAKSVTVE